ncbi:MAG: hypothetical protein ACRBBP_04750 [Bdellovibrionales bacterium]
MKRILTLLLLLGLSICYSKAYSAPSCSKFLHKPSYAYSDSIQHKIGQLIQEAIPEYRMARSDFGESHTLYADIRIGLFKKARLEVAILSDKRADITITPANQNHIEHAQKKMEVVYSKLIKDFESKQITDSLLRPERVSHPQTGETMIYMSLTRLNQARVDVLTDLIRRSLNLKPLPKKKYWEFESDLLKGDIYHIPARLKDHQVPEAISSSRNHLVPAYARPSNLPYHVKHFFDTTSGFKMILNRNQWIVEGLYESKHTTPKTLMLLITPDGKVTVLDSTPYKTAKPIDYADNLHSWIKDKAYDRIFGKDSDVTLDIHQLPAFLNELSSSGFTLIKPTLNQNVFPFHKDSSNN